MNNIFDCGDCSVQVPQFPEELCGIKQRAGGVKVGILFTCGFQWDSEVTVPPADENSQPTTVTIGSITDPAAWQTALDNNLIHKLPISLISIAEPEELGSKRINGCIDEIPTGYRYPVSIQSSIADDSGELSDFDYWCMVQENWNYFKFGYLDCNGNFFIGDDGTGEGIRGATVYYDHKTNSDDTVDWNFNFSIYRRSCIKPYVLDGIEQILT